MKKHASTRKKIILSCIIVTGFMAVTLYFTPTPNYHDGFRTLHELQAYAATINEYVPMDTENSIKPEFTAYFKTLIPTWKTKIRDKVMWWPRRFGLCQPPMWSTTFFKHQLLTLATTRQARQYTNNVVCKIATTPETRFFVIGTLQGALHSLVRDLTRLNERGVINDKLIVSDPNTYLIFMGDVVSRSPFSMETLSVVMKLLALNPSNVIYLRGGHESNNYWQEYTLKPELQMRAADLDKAPIPLADDINRFFNTLPLALYLAIPQQPNNFIRLSLPGRTANDLLQESLFASQLIAEAGTPLTHFDISKRSSTEEGIAITIPVIIKGEKKRETFQPHKGLRLLPSDKGSIAWTILSCPTPVYQRAVKFYYDTFIELCPATRIEGWTIILNNRDVRTKEPFKTTTFSLITGKELGAGELAKNEAPTKPQVAPTQPSAVPSTLPRSYDGTSAPSAVAKAMGVPPTQKPVANQTEADLITTLTAEAHELSQRAEALKKTADDLLKKLPQTPSATKPVRAETGQSADQPHAASQTKPIEATQTKPNVVQQEQQSSSAFEPIEQSPDEKASGVKPSSNNP